MAWTQSAFEGSGLVRLSRRNDTTAVAHGPYTWDVAVSPAASWLLRLKKSKPPGIGSGPPHLHGGFMPFPVQLRKQTAA